MIEIEKKYDVTDSDLKIIKESCELVSSKLILDKYFDTVDFLLFSNNVKLRKRNVEYQLKVNLSSINNKYSKALEITDKDEINKKLIKLGTSFEEMKQVLEISTKVDKFTLKFEGYNFTIDVQKYKYGYRYEIELELEEDLDGDIDPEQLINNFREYLGLKSSEQLINGSKISICAEKENIQLAKVIKKLSD